MEIAQATARWLLTAKVLFVVGCNGCHRPDPTPKLAEVEVIRIADSLARDEGYDLSKWHRPTAHFDYVEQDCTWFVSYNAIDNIMPGHFSVIVNDNTSRAELFGGM
jgi:hypothetical protein